MRDRVKNESQKLHALTISRFFAAISIVFFHYAVNVEENEKVNLYLLEPFQEVFYKANTFIIFFFILSGYLLTYVYKKGGVKFDYRKYYWGRAFRIFPVFWFSLLLSILNLILSNELGDRFTLLGFLKAFFLCFGWVNPFLNQDSLFFNIPSWTLSIEILFYIVLPYILILLKFENSIGKLIALILSIAFIYFANTYPMSLHMFSFTSVLCVNFVIGCLFYEFSDVIVGPFKAHLNIIVVILITLIYTELTFGDSDHLNYWKLNILFGLLIVFLANLNLNADLFIYQIMIFLGEISYSIYILQEPVFVIFKRVTAFVSENLLGIYFSNTILFYGYLLILISFSALAFKYIEKPAIKFIKGRV